MPSIESFVIIAIVLLSILTILFYSKNTTKSSKPIFVFWTGGYDSTFRICQLLYTSNKIVQPVYIEAVIDNDEDKDIRRRSVRQELSTMVHLRQMLGNPQRLLPTIVFTKVNIDDDISESMRKLHNKGKMRRPVCQYGALAQVTRSLKEDIEVSVENDPVHSMMYRTIHDSLHCSPCRYGQIGRLKSKPNDPDFQIFDKMLFPTITYTKKDMLKEATNLGFDNVLKATWSCWYPIDGRPCGMCDMCRERVV